MLIIALTVWMVAFFIARKFFSLKTDWSDEATFNAAFFAGMAVVILFLLIN